ncbi:FAD-dependent oxidoreductase [Nocardioides marmoriginsengisoli]|uniref:FAD-dependent oxidoreductase n=1 Tax=Nocardioides marmoriginsengisoli TaxID=661483 RepID=A0A3N0CIK1_9ACTN|nr:FAD-dependent oxidoreductase [Nocardioides marmoriginsengisoli]RNL63101.1 FAD-dependent oxidoreductase [Nocardioides marmoriginsengisoli]
MEEAADVVVVGAGLSGLIAARELRRAGLEVLVLEAADRCGGRAYSVTSSLGSRLDLGGQWVGHDHHRLAALADELGATRFVMHSGLAPRIVDGVGRVRLFSPSLLTAAAALALLNLARRTRNPEAWATTSVHAWLQKVPGRARRLLEVTALISWTADLERISVRTMMSLVRKQGGLLTMLSTKGGAQDGLITEGVGHLVDHLADDLGDLVRTGTTVTTVTRSADSVTVQTSAGSVRARRVVIAVPPPTAARIAHDPELPPERIGLQQGTFLGSVYKAIAVYPDPFWRTSSTGELLLLDSPGVAVFDTSAPGGPGHLCLLVGGPDARDLDDLDPTERRESLLGRIAEHLGAGVLEPADWHEKAWHLDPHAGGGYIAIPARGSLQDQLPMSARPVGRVHWAGTETASEHPGYLDGAIEAGERAAGEVVAALAGAS